MKIRPVEAELLNADRGTDIKQLIVVCRNFANAPKNGFLERYLNSGPLECATVEFITLQIYPAKNGQFL